MKNTAAIARQRFDRWSGAAAEPRLFTRQLLYAAIAGELLAAAALLATGSVPPVLVRSLQLFLRF